MKAFRVLSLAVLTSILTSCGSSHSGSTLSSEDRISCKGKVKLGSGKEYYFDSKANDYKGVAWKGNFECEAKAKLYRTNSDICRIFRMDVSMESKNGDFPFGNDRISWTCN